MKKHRLAACLASLMMLAQMTCSCASTDGPALPVRPAATVIQPAPNRQWVKVRDHPPTWFPLGVPADSPTDHSTGDWIFTEDAHGTCFFIPKIGLETDQRKRLLAEALAARSQDKVDRIHHEETINFLGRMTMGSIGKILWALGAAGAR